MVYFGRVVTAIAIQEHRDIGLTCCLGASQAGRTVATLLLWDYGRPGRVCHGRGSVPAAIIDDNHFLDQVTRHGLYHTTDGSLFVERWNNGHNAHGVPF